MLNFIKKIGRHAIGAVVGAVTGGVVAAPVAGTLPVAGEGDPVTQVAIALSVLVYAATEKALKGVWSRLFGETE